MYCPNCGTQIEQGARFCSSCGKTTSENAEERAATLDNQTVMGSEMKREGKVYKILGWIFFAISLLFFPVFFAAGTFIMGYLLRKTNAQNENHGTVLMVMGIAGGIFGMLLGMAASGY